MRWQAIMKVIAHDHQREMSFEDGSWVMLNSDHVDRFQSLVRSIVSYLSDSMVLLLCWNVYERMYNVFHCSVLKQHQGLEPTEMDPLPFDSVDNHHLLLAIMDFKIVTSAGVSKRHGKSTNYLRSTTLGTRLALMEKVMLRAPLELSERNPTRLMRLGQLTLSPNELPNHLWSSKISWCISDISWWF